MAQLEAALAAVDVKGDLLLVVDCRTALTEIDKVDGGMEGRQLRILIEDETEEQGLQGNDGV